MLMKDRKIILNAQSKSEEVKKGGRGENRISTMNDK